MKLLMANFYTLTPTPVGDTRIHDMLRYDVMFQNQDDPSSVMAVLLGLSRDRLAREKFRGRPTHDRWRSFGYVVARTTSGVPAFIEDIQTDRWTTYRHPIASDGGRDYNRLVPVTLRELLAARDLMEI